MGLIHAAGEPDPIDVYDSSTAPGIDFVAREAAPSKWALISKISGSPLLERDYRFDAAASHAADLRCGGRACIPSRQTWRIVGGS